jgi:hypothetical protein
MATIWNSHTKANNNSFTGTTLSSWSRQQKLAMLAGFVILGLLLAVSACSKQSAKPALVGVSGSASNPVSASADAPQGTAPQAAPASAEKKTVTKKAAKKRPANVTYTDAGSGVSFLYPRKFTLATGDKAQSELSDEAVPMNFVDAGGATIATVALPRTLYPGTDFDSAFFSVNVNRGLTADQCSHFAFVDTRNPDGEPVDAEKVKVGSGDSATEMEMTSEFAGSATRQAEAQYYHNYENGACYEYVLGLGTAGYGLHDGIQPVDRDEVFARLEKILATVKIKGEAPAQPVASDQVAERQDSTADSTK